MEMSKYTTELTSIVEHAKAIGFDINSGSIDDLMKSWIKSGLDFVNAASEDSKSIQNIVKKTISLNP